MALLAHSVGTLGFQGFRASGPVALSPSKVAPLALSPYPQFTRFFGTRSRATFKRWPTFYVERCESPDKGS